MADIAGLFARIQADAADSSTALADTLRRCIVLGGSLNTPELITWARAELDGYPLDAELPSYRRRHGSLRMDYIKGYNAVTGQEVTADLVDEEMRTSMYDVPLRQPLSELEFLAQDSVPTKGLQITPTDGGLLRSMVYRNTDDKAFLSVMAVYWELTPAAIRAVVDAVRTKLVTMVAEFDIEVAKPGTDTQTAARSAVNVVVETGGTFTLNNAPDGSITAGGARAVVTSNRADGDLTATISGSSATTTIAPAERKPRFWETAWWTVGRAITGGIMLALAIATVYFGWLATTK